MKHCYKKKRNCSQLATFPFCLKCFHKTSTSDESKRMWERVITKVIVAINLDFLYDKNLRKLCSKFETNPQLLECRHLLKTLWKKRNYSNLHEKLSEVTFLKWKYNYWISLKSCGKRNNHNTTIFSKVVCCRCIKNASVCKTLGWKWHEIEHLMVINELD